MKILVTGASGFVGHQLIQTLKQRYCLKVIAIGRSVLQSCADEFFVVSNFDQQGVWQEPLEGCDVVIHLAARVHVMHDRAEDPLEAFLAVNLHGTVNLANAAAKAGVKRFVYVSSIKVNGEYTEGQPFTAQDAPNPQDPYAVSKWRAEQALLKLSEETGMEVVIVRPPLVYGPGVKANFASLLNVVNKRLPLPLSCINNTRSMIYVGNLADALITCATHANAAGQTYLVCDNENVSTPQLIKKLAFVLKRPYLVFPFPLSIMRLLARLVAKSSAVDRLTQSLVIDCSTLCNELDWEPPFTMQEGLLETAQWYIESVKK
ncbi:MAG: SDR family oxidoreductase [Methylobacter sp.]|nr:SDR family oxidoreductase [Methylobacter sp.]